MSQVKMIVTKDNNMVRNNRLPISSETGRSYSKE